MKIIYSDVQKDHTPRWEWNFGKRVPYPEKNTRIPAILKALKARGFADRIQQEKKFPTTAILQIHDRDMVRHIQSCSDLPPGTAVHAHIFPYRAYDPHSKTDLKRAGYYCFDVGTQIDRNTYRAAVAAVNTALTGVQLLQSGKQTRVFSLCRPPGHHADRGMYGGYCYFNNAAISAFQLSKKGRVAVLDLDYHHGNGTQSIFYESSHVLVASIHGDPARNYPYFCGFRSERGEGLGRGANINIPLPPGVDDAEYQRILERALKRIRAFGAQSLVVSMGFDTFANDPLGDTLLSAGFYHDIGSLLTRMPMPVLVCLEGGYMVKELGEIAANFTEGLAGGA